LRTVNSLQICCWSRRLGPVWADGRPALLPPSDFSASVEPNCRRSRRRPGRRAPPARGASFAARAES